MVVAIWVLATVLYIVMGLHVGNKQYTATKDWHSQDDRNIASVFAGIFWFLTLPYYVVRVVFFEKWI